MISDAQLSTWAALAAATDQSADPWDEHQYLLTDAEYTLSQAAPEALPALVAEVRRFYRLLDWIERLKHFERTVSPNPEDPYFHPIHTDRAILLREIDALLAGEGPYAQKGAPNAQVSDPAPVAD